jgi:hypothetical protein
VTNPAPVFPGVKTELFYLKYQSSRIFQLIFLSGKIFQGILFNEQQGFGKVIILTYILTLSLVALARNHQIGGLATSVRIFKFEGHGFVVRYT